MISCAHFPVSFVSCHSFLNAFNFWHWISRSRGGQWHWTWEGEKRKISYNPFRLFVSKNRSSKAFLTRFAPIGPGLLPLIISKHQLFSDQQHVSYNFSVFAIVPPYSVRRFVSKFGECCMLNESWNVSLLLFALLRRMQTSTNLTK